MSNYPNYLYGSNPPVNNGHKMEANLELLKQQILTYSIFNKDNNNVTSIIKNFIYLLIIYIIYINNIRYLSSYFNNHTYDMIW